MPSEKNKITQNGLYATIVLNDSGEEIPINLEAAYSLIDNDIDEFSNLVKGGFSVVENYNSGFIAIDLHPNEIPLTNDVRIPLIYSSNGIVAWLKPGRYYVLYALQNEVLDEEEIVNVESSEAQQVGYLLATSVDQVEGENISLAPITIAAMGDNGEPLDNPPYEPLDLFLLRNTNIEQYEFITFYELLKSLAIQASLKLIVKDLQESGSLTITQSDDDKPLIIKSGKAFTDVMRGKPNKNDIWPTGESFISEVGEVQISAADEKALDIAMGSNKTLLYLNDASDLTNYKYSPNKVCVVKASLPELLKKRNLQDNKKNRAKVRKEVHALAITSWTVRNAATKEFITIPLAGGKCWARKDEIGFTFSPDFMHLVLGRDAGRIHLNPALLATDDVRNPYALTLGYKLTLQCYMNAGEANENTISVKKLLEYVEGIPSYEEVKATDRAYTRRIIEPLERDLNHLVEKGVLDYWDYCHKKGEPLTNEEQAQRFDQNGNERALPYETAINSNIQWRLTEEYPEARQRHIDHKEKKRLEAAAAKQKNEEKQKRIERKIENNIAKAATKKRLNEAYGIA